MTESVKLDIRPLEEKNLFTIRHVNSYVKGSFKQDPENKQKGKIIIEIDVEGGAEKLSYDIDNLENKTLNELRPKVKESEKDVAKEKDNKKTDPPKEMVLNFIYNENILKYNPNPNSALELTIKFSIDQDKIFFVNNPAENFLRKSPTDASGSLINKSPTDSTGGLINKSPTDTTGGLINKSPTDTTGIIIA